MCLLMDVLFLLVKDSYINKIEIIDKFRIVIKQRKNLGNYSVFIERDTISLAINPTIKTAAKTHTLCKELNK